MSILLEALRKSEKNQHAHEVPTIHEDDQSGQIKDSFKIGPLALLLIAAMFVSGWFVWRQYYAPVEAYQPPVTLEADADRAVAAPLATAGETGQATPQNTQDTQPAARKRTPVESYQQAATNTSPLNSAGPGAATNTSPLNSADSGAATQSPPDTPASEASRSRSTFKRLANIPDTQSTLKQAEDKEPTRPASGASDSGRPVAVSEDKRDSRETAPISYWELPDAIRNDVPEIKFSVLVYANNPADRFVLINGQRLGEGDNAQPGLVVKEIRLDGVVFSYRLYQFLVER